MLEKLLDEKDNGERQVVFIDEIPFYLNSVGIMIIDPSTIRHGLATLPVSDGNMTEYNDSQARHGNFLAIWIHSLF